MKASLGVRYVVTAKVLHGQVLCAIALHPKAQLSIIDISFKSEYIKN